MEPEKESIAEFLNLYNLKNLVKQNTCFKNSDKPTFVDLILINCPRSFQNADTFITGLLDFHKVTFTVLRQHFPKTKKPKVVIHRQYRSFRNDYLRIELENVLLKYDFNNIDYDNFIIVLGKHALLKEKCLRVIHANFMTKQLRKMITIRSKLRNDFHKCIFTNHFYNYASQTAYRKTRNLCVALLRKVKETVFLKFRSKTYNRQQKILEIC